ncbi:MAG: hypothetical protein JJT82_08915 [Legionellaceae bacterium]|nr:hypothetical protein [Legionellaceae bacterium]
MKIITRFRWFLWLFGRFRIRMIGYLRPKLIALSDEHIVIRIPLTARSRNHLHSMYFGALAVGADLAGGFHGFYHADKAGVKISLLFKSFQAHFIKRAEKEVYFISSMGEVVADMIASSQRDGERCHRIIRVDACTDYPSQPELVAQFELELSIKVHAPQRQARPA